jgi:hypothetical protein
MKMGIIQAVTWAGVMALCGALVSACSSWDQATSRSTAPSGAPWARDLNEPPPRREPANAAASRIQEDLNGARERALR